MRKDNKRSIKPAYLLHVELQKKRLKTKDTCAKPFPTN